MTMLWMSSLIFRIQHACCSGWNVIALTSFLFCNCGFAWTYTVSSFSMYYYVWCVFGVRCFDSCCLHYIFVRCLPPCLLACFLPCLFNHVEIVVTIVISFLRFASRMSVSNRKNIYYLWFGELLGMYEHVWTWGNAFWESCFQDFGPIVCGFDPSWWYYCKGPSIG